MKMLIFGAGHSAKRFVEANIKYKGTYIYLNVFENHIESTKKLANEFQIKMVEFDDFLNYPNIFDLIIFALNPNITEIYLKSIVNSGYKNRIIFEKPFAYNTKSFYNLWSIIKESKIIFSIMYNRRYDDYYNLIRSKHEKYDIRIVLSIDRFGNCLYDYFVHFLDYIFYCEDLYTCQLLSVCQKRNKLQFIIILDKDIEIKFSFIGTKLKTPIYYFNNKKISSPNYLQTHRKIVHDTINKHTNEGYLFQSSYAISKLLEELGEYLQNENDNIGRY